MFKKLLMVILISFSLCGMALATVKTIKVEFAFTKPNASPPAPQLIGYKLYKEGEFVCSSYKADYFIMDCRVDITKPNTLFTMVAYYSDGTEGPQSPTYNFQFTTIKEPDDFTLLTYTPAIWSLKYVDSEETAREDGAAINAFDGDPSTIWHTAWSTSAPACPHEIQINLGEVKVIKGIRYLPRQDGDVNGTIAKYAIYVSTDGVNWGDAVAQGTFTKDTTEKEVLFPATNGKFVRLVALSEINGKAWTSMAELYIVL